MTGLCYFDSLNWQHQLCSNPKQNPDIRTLFVDHTCRQPNESYTQLTATHPLMVSSQRTEGFLPMAANGVCPFYKFLFRAFQAFLSSIKKCKVIFSIVQPFQPAPVPVQTSFNSWMTNPSSIIHPTPSITLGAMTNPGTHNNVGIITTLILILVLCLKIVLV